MNLFQMTLETPSGPLSILYDATDTVYHIDFPDQGERQERLLKRRFKNFQLTDQDSAALAQPLQAYFAGDLPALQEIPVKTGGTVFQRKVWQALRAIPIGTTCSYRDLACQIGQPRAVRAVANANANNPISLLIPCHRVIGSDGTLTGYAGGLKRKEWLLRHEGAISQV